MSRRLILAGGTGFIGQALTAFFTANGYQVVILTRSPSQRRGTVHYQQWDGRSLGDWGFHTFAGSAMR